MERPYILLTPGPLTTSDRVKQVMLQDWCTWDKDYNENIVQAIRTELLDLAQTSSTTYTTVLLQGSGTYSVEAAISCSVSSDDRLLVFANGAYGDRIGQIAQYHKLNHILISLEETQQVTPELVEETLDNNPDITHVAIVHCETTTGIINPIETIAPIVKSRDKYLIVDAMSSFGGIPIPTQQLGIDLLISSSNKCIQGVPGFAFLIITNELLQHCKGNSSSLSLDIYDQWIEMEKGKGKWRFTSPTHVVRAFYEAIQELKEEGGIKARHHRYCDNQSTLVKGMERIGIKALLPRDQQSPIITSFLYPNDNFNFTEFYYKLKEKGFVIYPGKISKCNTFRIGNIGDVYKDDFTALVNDIAKIEL